MTAYTFLRSSLRAFAATLVLAFALVRPAHAAIDWTDIWWAPPEVGAGYNMVLSDNFMFVTFFVHGVNLEPDWYTGQMSIDASGNWAGGLYRTTGSYFAGPYQPGQTNTTQVGNVSFNPTSAVSGILAYNVGAVAVSRAITRLTLTTIALGGNYSGAVASTFSNCSDGGLNGAQTSYSNLKVTQTTAGALQLDFDSDFGQCTIAGNSNQNGMLFNVTNAAYSCYGKSMTAQLSEVKSTAKGIEGRWTANVGAAFPGCIENATFALLFIF